MQIENIYRQMLLLRRFEETLTKYYLDYKVFSFVHFYTGSEASAVGVCENLHNSDKVFGNHRSHGHYLAKGGCPAKLAAEMLGKATGCANGFGGSMHPVSKETGFLGTSPILGSSIPLSVGAAFAEKLKNTGNIAVGFTGDGASEEGLAIEAINLACAWELPHLTVIENNNYSVLTPIGDRRSKKRNNKSLYEGLGAVYIEANGRDFFDVFSKAKKAVEFCRVNQPVVLEIYTHRFLAHSTPLLDHHLGLRQNDTKEIMEAEDCLLAVEKLIPFDIVEHIKNDINSVMERAMEFCAQSEEPEPKDLQKYVYA